MGGCGISRGEDCLEWALQRLAWPGARGALEPAAASPARPSRAVNLKPSASLLFPPPPALAYSYRRCSRSGTEGSARSSTLPPSPPRAGSADGKKICRLDLPSPALNLKFRTQVPDPGFEISPRPPEPALTVMTASSKVLWVSAGGGCWGEEEEEEEGGGGDAGFFFFFFSFFAAVAVAAAAVDAADDNEGGGFALESPPECCGGFGFGFEGVKGRLSAGLGGEEDEGLGAPRREEEEAPLPAPPPALPPPERRPAAADVLTLRIV